MNIKYQWDFIMCSVTVFRNIIMADREPIRPGAVYRSYDCGVFNSNMSQTHNIK